MRPSRGKAYVELDMERLRKGGTVIMLCVVHGYYMKKFVNYSDFHFAPSFPKNLEKNFLFCTMLP
jgi:hypothetical protein